MKYHLIISCPDKMGIVAAVSTFVASHHGLILEADQYVDAEGKFFFMRYEIDLSSLEEPLEIFFNKFKELATSFNMNWSLIDANKKKKVIIFVSKHGHCLEDLLYRWQSKELSCDILKVISNHNDLKDRVEWYGIPFVHIPLLEGGKADHFEMIQKQILPLNPDLLILARYMQILPRNICEQYESKIINIHHSFLPSFMGAKPYHQAYAKGVKLIGATAHFVTHELDQGPIIAQDVIEVSHRESLDDYVKLGMDIEKKVLINAVKQYLDDRILIQGHKTIVFK
ncbi:MAG: formyltetrahydrofolate deformylase [Oligoflexales bacterium]